jgi:hypothetical protein
VIKGDARLEECPHLDAAALGSLQAAAGAGDWREELIRTLGEEVRGLRFEEIAAGLGAEVVEGSLRLRCLGREFTIAPDGTVRAEGRTTPWMRILLLHYVRTCGRAPLAGRWVSYAELKSGLVKVSSFVRDCEEPLLELFRREPAATAAALERLGGRRAQGLPTGDAWVLALLPKVPAAVLFWPADEEFGARVRVLFDATADQYLDAESLIFLGEGLVRNVELELERLGTP